MRFLTSIFIVLTISVANNGKNVTVDKYETYNFKDEAKELYDHLKVSGHSDKVNHVAKKLFDKLKVGGHLDKVVKNVAKGIDDKLKADHAEAKNVNKSGENVTVDNSYKKLESKEVFGKLKDLGKRFCIAFQDEAKEVRDNLKFSRYDKMMEAANKIYDKLKLPRLYEETSDILTTGHAEMKEGNKSGHA